MKLIHKMLLTLLHDERNLLSVSKQLNGSEGGHEGMKPQTRLATRSAIRSVSLQIRDYQVTVKVKTPVPQSPTSLMRSSLR